MSSEPKSAKNGLSWPLVAMVIASGGINLVGTQQGTQKLSYEQQEALQKIRELHNALEEFEARQKEELRLLSQIANK